MIAACSDVKNKPNNAAEIVLGPSNSFEKVYDTLFPNLNYSYDSAKQLHDYSDNWDIDGDSINDKLVFIGNGGAHLYFHPELILSKNSDTISLEFIEFDTPQLLKESPKEGYLDGFSVVFVSPLDDTVTPPWAMIKFYMRRQEFEHHKDTLLKHGIKGPSFAFTLRKGKPEFINVMSANNWCGTRSDK